MTAQPTAGTGDVQARARELLAKQYDLTGAPSAARAVREGALSPIERGDIIPAIVAALSSTAAPTPDARDGGILEGRIRFDFTNAEGQPDCKIISHDEMRQRYADLREQKEGWSAPVAGDAVAKLPEKWRKQAEGHAASFGAAIQVLNAKELEAALAQDRAAQAGAVPDAVRAELQAILSNARALGYVVDTSIAFDTLERAIAALAAAPTPDAEGELGRD